jgi:Cu2+-containing amine oxidase
MMSATLMDPDFSKLSCTTDPALMIIHIDVPEKRRPLNTAPPTNFDHESIQREIGFRDDLKPIHVTQPEGVSFKLDGRTIDWQKWNFHIGFNYREGIVLSNVTFNDRGNVRPVSQAFKWLFTAQTSMSD